MFFLFFKALGLSNINGISTLSKQSSSPQSYVATEKYKTRSKENTAVDEYTRSNNHVRKK